MSFHLTFVGDKNKQGQLTASGPHNLLLRYEAKRALKLQVPARYMVLSKALFDKSKPRKLMTPDDENRILKELKNNDTLHVSVAQFDIGNYTCTGDELGSGAFSQVYRGYSKLTNQGVAIKVVDVNTLETAKAREYHEQEKKIISVIHHNNIVHSYDILEEVEGSGKYIYIVMEFCEGGSLDGYIKNKPLSDTQARRLLIQLGEALRYLESKHIIHRDLKPQNILLTSKNIDEAIIKVCDFGFSRYYSAEDLIKSHPGTPLYESPDILFHRPYNDNKCDLWSVGAIFYEMLVGKPLFHTVRSMPELQGAVNASHKELLKFPPDIRPSRDAIDLLSRLLAQDSAKRITLEEFFRHPFIDGASKRTIYSIPDGYRFEAEIAEDTNVYALKKALAEPSRIPHEHQTILLENGHELENQSFIYAHQVLNAMYLYNNTATSTQHSLDIEPIPVSYDSPSPIEPLHISTEDIPIKKMLHYQHQFATLLRQQKAYLRTCETAYKKFEETMPLSLVHIKGLKSIVEHFNGLQRGADKDVTFITGAITASNFDVRTLLNEFDSILSKMRDMKLHEALHDSTHKTLLDCIDEKRVREDFATFKLLTEELRIWLEASSNLQKVFNDKPNSNEPLAQWHLLQNTKDKLRTNVAQCKSFVDFAEQSVLKAKQEIDRARKAMQSGGLRVDVTECFEDIMVKSKDYIEQSQQFEKEINTQMINCLKLRASTLNKIGLMFELRKKFLDYIADLPVQQKKMIEQQKLLKHIQHVATIPNAYASYVEEMIRRGNFHRTISKKATMANEHFSQLTKQETERIQLFLQNIGSALPARLFPGVDITGSTVKVEISVPQNNLLDKFSTDDSLKNSDDDFAIIISDTTSTDITELKKENEKLKLDLFEKMQQSSTVDVATLLEANASLKEKIESMKEETASFFEGYEKRFSVMQQKLKDAEEKERHFEEISAKEARASALIAQYQEEMNKLQAKLKASEEKLKASEERYSRSIDSSMKEHLQKGIQTIQAQYQKEVTDLKERIKVKDAEIAQKDNANSQLATQVATLQDEFNAYKRLMEPVLAKQGLSECPFCSEILPQKNLEVHVHEKHPF